MTHPAVFLDRDGTLIRDTGYLSDPAQVGLLPGALEALSLLRKAGMLLVLVSNQSGIGRGLFTSDDLVLVHRRLLQALAQSSLRFDGVYYCPHAPWDGCDCRKPRPGLLWRAMADLDIDPSRSFMVGDKATDVAAGRCAGCRTLLLQPVPLSGGDFYPKTDMTPDWIVPDLLTAARWIVTDLDGLNMGNRYEKPA